MPCVSFGKWKICVGDPTEKVTMRNGRVLKLEWHNYFGPSVETRRGTRPLTSAEFHDPNVDVWIVSHGGMSYLATAPSPASGSAEGLRVGKRVGRPTKIVWK